MGKRNKVTTRDIAEYTGVSQSTVSMILSEKKNVSFGEETVQKVKKAAKSLCARRFPTAITALSFIPLLRRPGNMATHP